MHPLDPSAHLPSGRVAIEASAGTGKTFTIAAWVTRLVAEAGIPIDKILVVTFTRAATAELKGRIRDRLVWTRAALAGSGESSLDDSHLRVLLDADPETRRTYVERLDDAITRFDRAQISTIHGFAIRMLSLLGFHSRVSPDLTPINVDSDLIRQVVADLSVAKFADDATDLVEAKTLFDIGRTIVAVPDAGITPGFDVEGEALNRVELAHRIREDVSRRVINRGYAGYDQLLIEARDALSDEDVGTHAKEALAKRFAVALIDESQDTDPVQWDIINAVFDDSRLVIIGDPKQSIYGFRGADIESYLASVDRAESGFTLDTNWRSDGSLIDALDAFFSGTDFGDERIRYREVKPAPGHELSRFDGPGSPFTIRRFDHRLPIRRNGNRPTGKFNRVPAEVVVAEDVAAHIVEVLTSGSAIGDGRGHRPVGPGDMAVLCRTGRQVDNVRAALTARGVPSVAARSGSVFVTPAATEWIRFLLGAERPERSKAVRYAATGLMIGRSLADVAAIDDDELVVLQSQMRQWRQLAVEHGAAALLGDLARTTGLVERVMNGGDGERVMTDLIHVAEEIDAARPERQLGSMLGWLEQAVSDAERDQVTADIETRERRLETDAAAVQVQTIHGAKGLEYPIVFCPYLWEGGKPRPSKVPVYHGPRGDDGFRRRLIDVGGDGSPDFAAHLRDAADESEAEDARLLYVALTRARHRLVVWWIDQAVDVEKTRLHKLLERGVTDDDDPAALDWLVGASRGTVAVRTLTSMPPTIRYEPPGDSTAALSVAAFDRAIDYSWRRTSYSALSPDHPISPRVDTDDAPLREDEPAVDPDTERPDSPLPMAGLPGGAAFGTLVHHILENVDSESGDLEAEVATQVNESLRFGSWRLDAAALTTGLVAALRTPLGPEPGTVRLADLQRRDVLHEMVFEFPVRPVGPDMRLGAVADAFIEFLPVGDPHRQYGIQLAEVPEVRFRGYLTGAIDLTARIRGDGGCDRFVVMDYKSNTLPTLGGAPSAADYAVAPMRDAMFASHYILQSLLYQVALHRYLQQRLPGYDPGRHLGGSAYLFIRGMIGIETPVVDGERCGVYRWNPPPELIVEVSRRFAHEGAS